MRKAAGMLAGGLFNVKLEGKGMIAITTHKEPITLKVTDDSPVMTDPQATVAWSGSLTPDLKTDISLKTFVDEVQGRWIRRHPAFRGEDSDQSNGLRGDYFSITTYNNGTVKW